MPHGQQAALPLSGHPTHPTLLPPDATKHVLQEPLPHAIPCLCRLRATVATTVIQGTPGPGSPFGYGAVWAGALGGKRKDLPLPRAQRPKPPRGSGRGGSTTGTPIRSSQSYGKGRFGSSITPQKAEHSSKRCCKIPQLEPCAQRCPCERTWCVNLQAKLQEEALTDLRMMFCHYGKTPCTCCGSSGRSKAEQVSRGYKRCLGHTLNLGTQA